MADARCEQLRWAEVSSRAQAGSLKWQLDKTRSKLKSAAEETKEEAEIHEFERPG